MSFNGQSGSVLQRSLLISFIAPTIALGFTHGPEGQLQAIYAKHAGIALTALALAGLLSKMLDAVTYPLIGYWSDRSFERRGTRRTWIVSGCLLSMLGIWFLMRPPAGATVSYYGIWMATTYIGWKLMEIPLQAWSYGLTDDYAQRSRVQAWRALAIFAGQLLFFSTPYLAFHLGLSSSTELDFQALGVAAVICVFVLPLAAVLLLSRVPEGKSAPRPPSIVRSYGVANTVRAAVRNGPLLRLLAAFLPVQVLAGLGGGVTYLFIDTYLGLGEQFPAIMGLSMLATLAGVPFWTTMGSRYERHRVWAAAMTMAGLGAAGLAFLTPGPGAIGTIFVLNPLILFCISSVVLVFSMSADTVDYERLQSGEDQSGLYGSLLYFIQKSVGGVSAAAGIAIVGVFGFDATSKMQTANGVLGIKLVTSILPAIGLIGAAVIIWNYSLTRARMEQVKADLARRDGELASRPEAT